MYFYYSDEMKQEMIELSANHVLWKLKGFDENLYYLLLHQYRNEFMDMYGAELHYLGRSGRHVCVANTPKNRHNHYRMSRTVYRMQKDLVKKLKESCKKTNI